MVIGSSSCPFTSHATPYISSLTLSLSSLRVTWFTTGTSRRHCSTSLALVRERERGGKERERKQRREREGEEERREKGRGRDEGKRGRDEGKRGRGREGDREGQDLCMLLWLNFKTMSLFIFIILFQDIFVRNMIIQLTFFLMSSTSVKDRPQLQQVTLQCIHNILLNIVIHALISLSLSLFLKDLLAIESDVAPIDLSENYLKSRQCLDTKSECERILGGVEKDGVAKKRRRTRGKYATNFFWQVIREREKRWREIFILYCYCCLNFTCIFLHNSVICSNGTFYNKFSEKPNDIICTGTYTTSAQYTHTLTHSLTLFNVSSIYLFVCSFSSS